ncbi:MAG: ATP-binding protein [Anaerolineales bacterium]
MQVKVSLPEKETVCIEVADTGPGIPPEQLPDIFEPFRRGSDYIEREHQGAGLGLSIAKQLVTSMGGQISAASTPKGTTFTICLPLEGAMRL